MSYSFNFVATSKSDALDRAEKELDGIVASQPVHVQDVQLALDVLGMFLLTLRPQADNEKIQVSMHGSLSHDWRPDLAPEHFPVTQAAVSVTVYYTKQLG